MPLPNLTLQQLYLGVCTGNTLAFTIDVGDQIRRDGRWKRWGGGSVRFLCTPGSGVIGTLFIFECGSELTSGAPDFWVVIVISQLQSLELRTQRRGRTHDGSVGRIVAS